MLKSPAGVFARGKRHKAQQGVVNVLSGAPYGYHYVKKSDASAGYYTKWWKRKRRWCAGCLRMYTQQQLSINAMARQLNQRQILTRSERLAGGTKRYGICCAIRLTEERLAMAKRACNRDRRALGLLRQRTHSPHLDTVNSERSRNEWIEVSIPH